MRDDFELGVLVARLALDVIKTLMARRSSGEPSSKAKRPKL